MADSASASGPSEPVRRFTFDNGLELLVREDRSAPVVSVQAWCGSGSIHEGEWLGAGLSHALEHMLFKGTERRPPGRIDREVQDVGGQMNAYTAFDRTVYWIDVPEPGWKIAVDVLCDIMSHATLPEDELEKEKQVILREMDMNHDDPGRRAGRRLFEVAYTRSPYRYTVIGYPDIFQRITRQDLLAYYHRNYVPDNLFVVVVGAVSPEAVAEEVGERLGRQPRRALVHAPSATEPAVASPRIITEHASVQLAHYYCAWHVPELLHEDTPALDVLSSILGAGRSSRLYREIRDREQLVTSADAWLYLPSGTGLFGLSAVLDGDKLEPAEQALLREVARLTREPVSSGELDKVLRQFTSGTLASRKTMQGQAQDLGGNWLQTGDPEFSDHFLARARALTPDHLQAAAQRWLSPDRRVRYALLPERSKVSTPQTFTTTEPRLPSRVELSNGLRVILKEDARLPFVEIRLALHGGVLRETPENNGITQLLARTWPKGTDRLSAEEIATRAEGLGGYLEPFAGNNSFGLKAEFLSESLDAGLDLFREVLTAPAFPEGSVEREKQAQLDALLHRRDQLLPLTLQSLRKALFGNQGYGLELLGRPASVQALRAPTLIDQYRAWTVPNQAVLAVYGDIHSSALKEKLEELLSAWAARPGDLPVETPSPSQPGERRVREVVDKKQAVVALGFPGTTLAGELRPALDLLQEACSDLGSRLFTRIREELGLAYYVGAQHFPGLVPGYFAFYTGTAPEHAEQVEAELRDQARRLAESGLTEEELTRAQAKVIGHRTIARQDLGHQAFSSALDELYGFGFDFSDREQALYESVTLDQVREAAATFLRPEVAVVAHTGPEGPSTPG